MDNALYFEKIEMPLAARALLAGSSRARKFVFRLSRAPLHQAKPRVLILKLSCSYDWCFARSLNASGKACAEPPGASVCWPQLLLP